MTRHFYGLVAVGAGGVFLTSVALAQIFDCGGFWQRSCQRNYYVNETVIEGPQYCSAGLQIINSQCDFDRRGWPQKQLDMNRSGVVSGISCGGTTNISCWRVDDETRDKLEMDSSRLNFVTQITANAPRPSSGRFIYVYRVSDGKLMARRYDRAHTEGDPELSACLNYQQYRFPPNMRNGQYQHVRHTQLNGGWGPVYCAGEVTIKDGQLWRLNNASGHYQPDVSCLAKVEQAFLKSGYGLRSDYQKGAHAQVSAAETSCPAPTGPDQGPDDVDHDEL